MDSDLPTIVIVDDASEVRLLIKTRIRLSGRLKVVGEGSDGAEAVALAAQHQPTLMLLDVSMPGMDGLGALPKVLSASPSTRVVLYSGFEEMGLIEKAGQLGAAAFIQKSVPVESVVDRLVAVLGEGGTTGRPADASVTETVVADDRRGTPSPDQRVLDEHLERFREVFDEAAIGMATMTLTGHLVRANRALATLVQRSPEELVGHFYGELTDGQEEAVSSALEKVARQSVDVAHLEHGVTGASDARQVRATLAPVRDSGGRALYLFLQVQDVTVERAAAEELRRSEERFRLLIAAVQDYAIFMLSPDGVIVSWNAGAQRSTGYTEDEIIGQHFRVFYPPEVQARRHPEHELELALRDGSYTEDGWRIRKDGSRFWANVVITPVFDPAGRHVGFAKVTRDITERRDAEEALRQSEERFRRAGRDRPGLRDLHALARRRDRQLERRRRADQGLPGRRDHRPALPRVLPARGPGPPAPRARAGGRRSGTGTTRRRAGGYARTARGSGPTSSSPQSSTRPASSSGSPRSPATTPTDEGWSRSAKRRHRRSPRPTQSWRP